MTRFSPISQGSSNNQAALARRFAQSVVEQNATLGNITADGLFAVQTEVTPVDAESRISLSVKASIDDAAPVTASLYLDALASGKARIVMTADQVTIQDNLGNVLAAWGSDGSLNLDRINANSLSGVQFFTKTQIQGQDFDSGVTPAPADSYTSSLYDINNNHWGTFSSSLRTNDTGFAIDPTSAAIIAEFRFMYKPQTSAAAYVRGGLEGLDGANTWHNLTEAESRTTTNSNTIYQTLTVKCRVPTSIYYAVKPWVHNTSGDVIHVYNQTMDILETVK